jgi:hypothetical protein
MREDVLHAAFAKEDVERAGEHLGHFTRGRATRVVLLVDVGVVATVERGDGIALGEARHAPTPDR